MLLTPTERGEVRHPDEPIIRESVNRSVNAMSSPPTASPAPPRNPTTAREDEDGVIHTVHPFILDLDSMDDPNAVMV